MAPREKEDTRRNPSALMGTLKLIAMIALALVAGLAILLVLDVIPRDAFSELSVKIALVTGIVSAVSCAIALLMRAR